MAARVVVNADDFGLSRGANEAIERAHAEGVVTSASMAVSGPAFGEAVEIARRHPSLGLGLHFTLSAGAPIAPADQVPRLLDEKGNLALRFLPLFIRLSRGSAAELLNQIGVELDAQLDRAAAAGLKLDHIDGERHIHLIPRVFQLVAQRAVRRGIQFIRLIRDVGGRYVHVAHWPAIAFGGGPVKKQLLESLSQRCEHDLPPAIRRVDHYATLLYTGRMDLILNDILSGPPTGVTEIAVHPGISELSRTSSTGNAALDHYLRSSRRDQEFSACLLKKSSFPDLEFVRFADLAQL
jgi:predicted glycoside hydrolase/deacetylase ChbG (UPF0249 family)